MVGSLSLVMIANVFAKKDNLLAAACIEQCTLEPCWRRCEGHGKVSFWLAISSVAVSHMLANLVCVAFLYIYLWI